MTMNMRAAVVCLLAVVGGVGCDIVDEVPDASVAAPDLYIKSFALNPPTPVEGSPVVVTITVGNKGGLAVSSPSQVGWYGGENYPSPNCEWTIGSAAAPIPAGGEVTISCTYAGYPSWYASINTKVVVDATNKIDEGTPEAEANNTLLKNISVGQRTVSGPDLFVSATTLDPVTPVQGQPVRVTVTIGNKGSAAVPVAADIVRWFPTDAAPNPGCVWTIGQSAPLAPGASTTVQCTYAGYPSWYASIDAKTVVDATGVVSETDETNNTLLSHLSVSK